MENKWNKGQQHVIDWRGSTELVSAAAGSGKTATLVERIYQRIVNDGADIESMIVVTFTKAAAFEMKERIRDKLLSALREEQSRPSPEKAVISRLERQLQRLSMAQISTIDSFCQNIIKTRFYAAPDLDPAFRVLDEDEAVILKSNAADEILAEIYEKAKEGGEAAEAAEEAAKLSAVLSGWKNDEGLKNAMISIFDRSITLPDPGKWLSGLKEIYNADSIEELKSSEWMKEELRLISAMSERQIKRAREALSLISPYPEDQSKNIDILGEEIELLEKAAKAESITDASDALNAIYARNVRWSHKRKGDEDMLASAKKASEIRGIYAKKDSSFYKKIVSGIAGRGGMEEMAILAGVPEDEARNMPMDELILSRIRSQRGPALMLISLAEMLGESFAASKRDAGAIDFNDMEHMALSILTDDVAADIAEGISEIMIDEYQDSNLLQEAILTRIAAGNPGITMFMVGDVKQSIYSFRHAEPSLFLGKLRSFDDEELFESGTEELRAGRQIAVSLDMNYRSRREVLDTVNEVFSVIMTEDLGGVKYDSKASLKYSGLYDDVPGDGYKTELILIDRERPFDDLPENDAGKDIGHMLKAKTLQTISIQVTAAAARIRELVLGEHPLMVKDGGGQRPARYSDIAILTRSNLGTEIGKILEEFDIPYISDARSGYFDQTEVSTVINFLKIIDNPLQDIPLISVMRSVFFEFTDEELAAIRAEDRNSEYFLDAVISYDLRHESDTEPDTLRHKISAFLGRLNELRDLSGSITIYDMLGKLFYEMGYIYSAASQKGGVRKRANLEFLLKTALSISARGRISVRDFTELVAGLENEAIDYGQAPVNADGEDAVSIMTIHKSKGLEYPVVFILGMEKEFNRQDERERVICDAGLGLAMTDFSIEHHVKSKWNYEIFLKYRNRLSRLAEEMRVLYVAMTRAREKLIMVGTFKKDIKLDEIASKDTDDQKNYLEWVLKALSGKPEIISAAAEYSAEREKWLKDLEDGHFRIFDKVGAIGDLEVSVYSYLGAAIITEESERDALITGGDRDDEEMRQLIDEETLERLKVMIRAEYDFKYAYEGIPERTAKMSVSRIKEGLDEPIDRATGGEENRLLVPGSGLSAAELGDIYHAIMRRLDLTGAGEDIPEGSFNDKLIERYEKYIRREHIEAFLLEGKVTPRMAAADKVGRLYREQPFIKKYDIEGMKDVPVQGVIDAFFIDEDGEAVLLDYKTDGVTGRTIPDDFRDILRKRHTLQLSMYAEALRDMLNVRVKEIYIYSFTLGEYIDISDNQ